MRAIAQRGDGFALDRNGRPLPANIAARQRFDAGLSAADAARDIALGDYSSWGDSERIAVNVDTLYREFDPTLEPGNLVELFTLMGELTR